MKIITIRTQIREVAKRWKLQYGRTRTDIANLLEALDVETATAEDVERIIGNGSWVHPIPCDECREKHEIVVQLGEEPDYESSTVNICQECLRKALMLIDGSRP